MASDEQINANRINAQHSTGPKTQEGKDASSKNALKHGMLARRHILLAREDASVYAEFRESLLAALKPVGALEELLVEQIVVLAWRLGRAPEIEAGILAWYEFEVKDLEDGELRGLEIEAQYNNRIAQLELQRLEIVRKRKEAAGVSINGRAWLIDCARTNALTKLSRIETTTHRNFFRTLRELEQLQTARKGQTVAPTPLTIDVEPEAPKTEEKLGDPE